MYHTSLIEINMPSKRQFRRKLETIRVLCINSSNKYICYVILFGFLFLSESSVVYSALRYVIITCDPQTCLFIFIRTDFKKCKQQHHCSGHASTGMTRRRSWRMAQATGRLYLVKGEDVL